MQSHFVARLTTKDIDLRKTFTLQSFDEILVHNDLIYSFLQSHYRLSIDILMSDISFLPKKNTRVHFEVSILIFCHFPSHYIL